MQLLLHQLCLHEIRRRTLPRKTLLLLGLRPRYEPPHLACHELTASRLIQREDRDARRVRSRAFRATTQLLDPAARANPVLLIYPAATVLFTPSRAAPPVIALSLSYEPRTFKSLSLPLMQAFDFDVGVASASIVDSTSSSKQRPDRVAG